VLCLAPLGFPTKGITTPETANGTARISRRAAPRVFGFEWAVTAALNGLEAMTRPTEAAGATRYGCR